MIDKAMELQRLSRNRHLSAEELRLLQERKLRELVQHAYQHVPYYRSLFQSAGLLPEDIRTLEDLPRIPVTRKEDLKAAGLPDVVAQGTDLSRCVVIHTSGTTGRPFEVYLSHAEASRRRMVQFRAVLSVGFRPWERLVILGPSVPGPRRLRHRLGLYRTDVVLGNTPVTEQLALLGELCPNLLWAYPTALHPVVHRTGYELHRLIQPRLLITSAELFAPSLRERVKNDLGVDIFELYGAMEVGRIAVDCSAHGGLHVQADQVLLECLVKGHIPVSDTPGDVVVTALEAHTMPFIRYHLGDTCRLLSRPCSCGSAFPLLAGLSGRDSDILQLPSGNLRLHGAVTFVLRRFDWIDQFLAIQDAPDRIAINLVVAQSPTHRELERLRSELLESLGEPVELVIELVDELPPQPRKVGGFVSRLPPPNG